MTEKSNRAIQARSILQWTLAGIAFWLLHIYLSYVPKELSVTDFQTPLLASIRPSILLISASILVLSFSKILSSFSLQAIFPDKKDRWFLHILIALTAWPYISCDYNFFLDSWFLYDRIILLLLLLASFRNGLFLLPLLALVALINAQYELPIGGAGFLDKRLPFEVLKWTFIFILLKGIFEKLFQGEKTAFTRQTWFFGMLCLFASYYFYSGWGKIALGENIWYWAATNEVSNNFSAMHARGWLASYPSLFAARYWFYDNFAMYGQWIILVGELMGLVALFHRRILKIFIGLMIFLHLNVFLLNGALFLGWIIIGLFLFRVFRKKDQSAMFFSKQTGIVSVVLIGLIPYASDVPNLAWFDGPVDNRFELFATNPTGEEVKVSLASLQPFTINFQKGLMNSLVTAKVISTGFLVFDKSKYQALKELNPDETDTYIQEKGISKFNKDACYNMHLFLTAYQQNQKDQQKVMNKYLHYIQLPAYWNAHKSDDLPTLDSSYTNIKLVYSQAVKQENGRYKTLIKELVFPRECVDITENE